MGKLKNKSEKGLERKVVRGKQAQIARKEIKHRKLSLIDHY